MRLIQIGSSVVKKTFKPMALGTKAKKKRTAPMLTSRFNSQLTRSLVLTIRVSIPTLCLSLSLVPGPSFHSYLRRQKHPVACLLILLKNPQSFPRLPLIHPPLQAVLARRDVVG